ncbi:MULTISPECIES: MerR family transcriptional regulator [Micromonospora]|uniref:MerR family transcriptional regulator n=1 Tax=Micromonospora TaxID=1873 RepID=UPI001EE88AEB|nr:MULTISPECIES: MerR family transcriptional regulator [Micromonospora]MCG5452370.1 MerR family transcriptional regulator [Micromonospora hortensis]MCX5121668.1 MerR family transcriptional regulator [Micromonospora sp. NBC_00362]
MAATKEGHEQAEGPLTIQEMAQRSGFSEPTLRYYEKAGLLGAVPRDDSSGHRRYDTPLAERIDALACLRSAGMSVADMRRYLTLLDEGDLAAAAEQRDLFARHADRLSAEIERLRVRQAYLRAKADMWDARHRSDTAAETRALTHVKRALEKF